MKNINNPKPNYPDVDLKQYKTFRVISLLQLMGSIILIAAILMVVHHYWS